jgi:hypothetical protein
VLANENPRTGEKNLYVRAEAVLGPYAHLIWMADGLTVTTFGRVAGVWLTIDRAIRWVEDELRADPDYYREEGKGRRRRRVTGAELLEMLRGFRRKYEAGEIEWDEE